MKLPRSGQRFATRTAALLLAASFAPRAAADGADRPEALRGHELLAICGGPHGPTQAGDRCNRYFETVLDHFDRQEGRPGQLHYCLPVSMTTPDLVELYKRESQIFPDVLDAPAEKLIVGMVLKFFPCRARQQA